jgi:hypothetical protein
MTEQKALWGWYPAGNVWVKLQVAATGKLVIDPTAIFEEPPTNGEMEKAATSNWSFDHDADPDAHHARLHTMTDALDHAGSINDAQHGVRTLANAHNHADLSNVLPNQHHARLHTMTDALDHTGRIALSQMTPGGLGLVLTGQGAGVDPTYSALSSRELWAPVTYGISNGVVDVLGVLGNFPDVYCSALNDIAHVSFRVPSDFTSLLQAKFVVVPQTTLAAADWDIAATYASVGEGYNTHIQSDAVTTYNVTIVIIYEVDLSGILSNIAAGDYVGVSIKNAGGLGHRFYALGVRFKYS